MSLLTASKSRPTTTSRLWGRWLVSFTGFPLGGFAAMLATGPVDGLVAAVAGGLVTGAVLGAVQAWALRADRALRTRWIAATAVGLALGLAFGAWLVGFRTGAGDLALQGAVSGAVVGVAQAVVLARRVGPIAAVWPPYLAGVWALAWMVTTAIGVDIDQQFTVFGSAGAVVAALLTSFLPAYLLQTRYAAAFRASERTPS